MGDNWDEEDGGTAQRSDGGTAKRSDEEGTEEESVWSETPPEDEMFE